MLDTVGNKDPFGILQEILRGSRDRFSYKAPSSRWDFTLFSSNHGRLFGLSCERSGVYGLWRLTFVFGGIQPETLKRPPSLSPTTARQTTALLGDGDNPSRRRDSSSWIWIFLESLSTARAKTSSA